MESYCVSEGETKSDAGGRHEWSFLTLSDEFSVDEELNIFFCGRDAGFLIIDALRAVRPVVFLLLWPQGSLISSELCRSGHFFEGLASARRL
jgi:hypothetical protein